MKQTKKDLNTKNRKGAFGVLFSLIIGLVALPIWVGAISGSRPHIDLFAADAINGFRINQEIEFRIKGADKEDARLDAVLDYGDGDDYNFRLLGGAKYLKKHSYDKAGHYIASLTLKDSDNKEKKIELDLRIYDKWIPEIKTFKFNQESSLFLGERVYVDYEIECDPDDNFELKIDWGDGSQEDLDIFCGPAVISHEFKKATNYEIVLKIRDLEHYVVASRSLSLEIEESEEEEEISGEPKANFFIKTAWPRVGEPVYFRDSSTDPDGRGDLKKWTWDFGDNRTSSDLNPSHIYRSSGRFKVKLTIRDRDDNKDTVYQWIEVFKGIEDKLVRVRGKSPVYHIIQGQWHWLPNPDIFYSYGYRNQDIQLINQSELNTYSRAKLVRVNNSDDIYYLTENWMKRKIPNMQVFDSYRNEMEDVISISQKELNWYEDNRLIKYDNDWKVYYLDNGVKHWIKTAEAFNRIGLDWSKVAPVNWQEINAYPTGSAIN